MQRHRIAAVTVITLCAMAALSAQNPEPRFEVVSIKPNTSGETGYRWTFDNGRFTATYVTPKLLISTAYGLAQQPLPDFQIIGGPNWIGSERFDVLASGPPTAPLPPLLRQLIEDRFALRTHFEEREMPIYALVMARTDGSLGPKMRRNDVDCAAIAAGRVSGERCGGQILPGNVVARGISMTQMVSGLARLMPNVGRPVLDRTGLAGSFNIELTWTPDTPVVNTMPNTPLPPVDPNGPDIFTALQEQLGLKLESSRAPVNVLVIDHIERPTEN